MVALEPLHDWISRQIILLNISCSPPGWKMLNDRTRLNFYSRTATCILRHYPAKDRRKSKTFCDVDEALLHRAFVG